MSGRLNLKFFNDDDIVLFTLDRVFLVPLFAKKVISIPADALVPEGDAFRVFVVDAKNVAHARPVTIGVREPGRVEIKSGLAAGERVVTYGAYGLDDGSTVVMARQ